MKATKEEKSVNEEQNSDVPILKVMSYRLVEAGVMYPKGSIFPDNATSYDRLVFLLGKENLWPVGGWQELPEPLFTDVMARRG